MIELHCGQIKLIPNFQVSPFFKLSPGQILKSENAYIASVLQTGKVIGNSTGKTKIWIEENNKTIYEIECTVKEGASNLPLLLNRYNKISGPIGELVNLPQHLCSETKEIQLERNTAKAFDIMVEHAKEQDIWLIANFGYRSIEQQLAIIEYYKNLEGEEAAMRRCAPAGFSEHHSGLSIDIGGGTYCNTQTVSDKQAVCTWIANNCHKFGFMLKNLKGKEHITGTRAEPWHIRYLGDIALCELLHNEQITLDEYLDALCL